MRERGQHLLHQNISAHLRILQITVVKAVTLKIRMNVVSIHLDCVVQVNHLIAWPASRVQRTARS